MIRSGIASSIPKRVYSFSSRLYSSSLNSVDSSSSSVTARTTTTTTTTSSKRFVVAPPPEFIEEKQKTAKGKPSDKNAKRPVQKVKQIIDGSYLTQYFSSKAEFPMLPMGKSVQANIKMLMLNGNIELDRCVYDYDKIPGETPLNQDDAIHNIEDDEFIQDDEPLPMEAEARENKEELDISEEDQVFVDKYDRQYLADGEEPLKEAQSKHFAKMEKRLKEEDMFNNLPEVLLMGRCNVGKSSLVNALLSSEKSKARNLYARVKAQPGYTQCLNMYNIGNRLRLVDSPGYGEKGKIWQGNLVMDYLQRRRVLKRAYVLLDAKVGVTRYDEIIIDRLVEMGISFDIVFTKIDKLPNAKLVQSLEKVMEDPVLRDLKIKPNYYFTNNLTPTKNAPIPTKTGLLEVRRGILEACGYDMNHKLKPIRRNIQKEKKVRKGRRHEEEEEISKR